MSAVSPPAGRLPRFPRVPPSVWASLGATLALTYLLLQYSRRVVAQVPPPAAVFGADGKLVVPVGAPGPYAPHPTTVTLLSPQHAFDLAQLNLLFLVLTVVLWLVGTFLLHRRALTALAVLLAGSVSASLALGNLSLPEILAPAMAVGTIAATGARRASRIALWLTIAVVAVHATWRVVAGFPVDLTSQASIALAVLLAWTVGNSARSNRDHAEALRAQATAQAVIAERLRIARELHDMVAHSTGIVALQAGAAARVIETQPLEARKALTAIESTSRETLSGLRRMLGVLRQADRAGLTLDVGLTPGLTPGLADVERLAAGVGAAGVRVDVSWHGARRRLPAEIELSAFRIVQEAVTNVARHAGVGACGVSVRYLDAEVVVEVVDAGRGGCSGAAAVPGYGIVGMRERVALLRGDFSAGPRPGGGFEVVARLPVPAAVTAPAPAPVAEAL